MNRIKYIYEIIGYLAGYSAPKKLKEITLYLSGQFEEDITERRVKQYLKDIQDNFGALENVRGRDGGYMLDPIAREDLIRTSLRGMDTKSRNAINDAFEVAERSASYHYAKELIEARGKFYSHINMKDLDREHYIGIPNKSKFKNILYKLKDEMVNNHKVYITAKYNYNGINKERTLFAPLFVIHDSDETFIVLRDTNLNYVYQNLNNIIKVESTNKPFARTEQKDKNYNKHIIGSSIASRSIYRIKIRVTDDEGWKYYDLWHLECKEISRTKGMLELEFYEDYRAAEFLFNIGEYSDFISIPSEIKKYMKRKINSIK